MKALSFIIIFFLIVHATNAQEVLTQRHIDSIAIGIDNANYLQVYTKDDSLHLDHNIEIVRKYCYMVGRDGQVVKIKIVNVGSCESIDQFYYLDGKLLKARIRWECSDEVKYDSELYFLKDNVVAQTHRAIPLYGIAVKQSAYNALSRVMEFRGVAKGLLNADR
jgi:hypothetical protein